MIRAYEALEAEKNGIVQTWMGLCRQKIPAAANERDYILRDDIPDLLDDLAEALKESIKIANFSYADVSGQTHGKVRSQITSFSLEQLIHEYRLLRKIIFETLESQCALKKEERILINDYLDHAASQAAETYTVIKDFQRDEINRKSSTFLRNFAAIAAHDIKSPLATATNYINLLREKTQVTEEQRDEYMNRALEIIERTSMLMDQLLGYSSPEPEIQEKPRFNLANAARSACSHIQDVIRSTDARIEFTQLPEVEADFPLIVSVFQNLLSNSIKYRGNQPPRIEIRYEDKDGHYLIELKDNGVGFSSEQEENIFDLFYQVSEGRAAGSGIGLAMCKKIIEAHGGKIWAKSSPGSGSTFFFTLPKPQTETKK